MDNPTQNLYREEANQEAEEEKKKQPNSIIRVSEDTHEALKEAAEDEERSIKAVADRAIRQGLTKGQNRASKQYQMNSKGELI